MSKLQVSRFVIRARYQYAAAANGVYQSSEVISGMQTTFSQLSDAEKKDKLKKVKLPPSEAEFSESKCSLDQCRI